VALGAGLLVAERFPEQGAAVLSIVVGTTIVYELFGPLATTQALERAGETNSSSDAVPA
jgi:hypothetical protein